MKISSMLMMLCLLFGGSTLMAQKLPNGPKKDQLEQWKEELQLTDQQVTDIKQIHKSYNEAMKAVRQNDSLSPDVKKEQLNILREKRQTEIEAKLTPEQRAKKEQLELEQLVDNRSSSQSEKLEKELLLSPEQKKEVEILLQESIRKTQELKKSSLNPEEKRAKVKEIQGAKDSRMKEILSQEQYEKYQSYLESEKQNAKKKAKEKRANKPSN